MQKLNSLVLILHFGMVKLGDLDDLPNVIPKRQKKLTLSKLLQY